MENSAHLYATSVPLVIDIEFSRCISVRCCFDNMNNIVFKTICTRYSHKVLDLCLLKVNRNNFMKTTCVGLKRDISCSYFENMNHVVQCVIY